MPTTLPPPAARLTLRDTEGNVWTSKVESIDADTLAVARPFDLPLEDGPRRGDSIELTWTADGGAFSLPARLIGTVRDGLVVLWTVAPEGETFRSQRRAHFRVPVDGDITVTLVDEPAATAPRAHLVDVSEAALRFRVTPADAEPFHPRTKVGTRFELRQESFEVDGVVLRSWPSQRANGEQATDVVVELDLTQAQARDLRRVLLAEQVQRRRVSRD
jgi:c-di-GMP-binding flagellar brake protein YcgR